MESPRISLVAQVFCEAVSWDIFGKTGAPRGLQIRIVSDEGAGTSQLHK